MEQLQQRWTDISSNCRIAIAALKNKRGIPMITRNTFQLHDSMSASELQDKKMDSLFRCNFLHRNTAQDLYTVSNEWFSWDFVTATLLFLLKSEISIFNGLSVMETTHFLSVVWKDGTITDSMISGERSLQMQLIQHYVSVMSRSISKTMNSVLVSDIYEDEEFCPGFRSYLWQPNTEGSHDRLENIRANLSSFAGIKHQNLLEALIEYRLLMLRWSEKLDAFTAVLQGGFPSENTESMRGYLLSNGLSEFLDLCSSLCLCIGRLSNCLAIDGLLEEELLSCLQGKIKKDFLPCLVTNGPRRQFKEVSVTGSVQFLAAVVSQTQEICRRMERWSNAPDCEQSFEEVFREAEDVYRSNFHVIPRSLWFAFQNFRVVLIDRYLWSSVVAWRGGDLQLPLAREWIKSNVASAAWDLLRLLCTKRSHTFSRIHATFVRWGQLTTESLYLDERLLGEDQQAVVSERGVYWFATWTAMLSTLLMNFQMTLMVEMQVLEVGELDYFYWYWDYIFSTHLHAVEKLRSCSLQPGSQKFSSCPDQILRACGQLCRGGFRLILACKYFGIIDSERFKTSLSSYAVVFENRFKSFREIINPAPLTYQEFATTMKKDLDQLMVLDNSVITRQSLLQIINASLFCYKTAKSLLDSVKSQLDQDRCGGLSLLALAKVTIAQQLQLSKLKKVVESGAAGKKIHLSVNYQYHEHFGVVEVHV